MVLNKKLQEQIARADNDPRYILFNGILKSEDRTLVEELAGRYEEYESLNDDAEIRSVAQKRAMFITSRELKCKAGGDRPIDKEASLFCFDTIMALSPDKLTSSFMDGIEKGYAPVELMWGKDRKNRTVPRWVSAVEQDRVKFLYPGVDLGEAQGGWGYSMGRVESTAKLPLERLYQGYEMRVLTQEHQYYGVPVPDRKFLLYSWGSSFSRPTGKGIGGTLYWLKEFKKEVMKHWLIHTDRFASPTPVAEYEPGRSGTRAAIEQALENISRDGYIVVPKGTMVSLLESSRENGPFEPFLEWADRQIAKLYLGETLSTQEGASGGSRAATETHLKISSAFMAKRDADDLSEQCFNVLCRWLTEVNYPEAEPPTLWRIFPELDYDAQIQKATADRASSEASLLRVERDIHLVSLTGKRLSTEYVEKYYDVEFSDDPIDPIAPASQQSTAQEDPDDQRTDDDDELPGFDEGNNGPASRAYLVWFEGDRAPVYSEGRVRREAIAQAKKRRGKGKVVSRCRMAVGDEIERFKKNPTATRDYAATHRVISVAGLNIGIEYEPGELRHGREMKVAYGHIRGHVGADREALDAYVHPSLTNFDIWKVNQLKMENGEFDEEKIFIGPYPTAQSVKNAWSKQMPPEMFGGAVRMQLKDIARYRRSPKPAQETIQYSYDEFYPCVNLRAPANIRDAVSRGLAQTTMIAGSDFLPHPSSKLTSGDLVQAYQFSENLPIDSDTVWILFNEYQAGMEADRPEKFNLLGGHKGKRWISKLIRQFDEVDGDRTPGAYANFENWNQKGKTAILTDKAYGVFAGPDKTLPIITPKDAIDAWNLSDHCEDTYQVKANILKAASHLGFAESLPSHITEFQEHIKIQSDYPAHQWGTD